MTVERDSEEPKLVMRDSDGEGDKFNPDDGYEQAVDLKEPNQVSGQYGNEGDPKHGSVGFQGDPAQDGIGIPEHTWNGFQSDGCHARNGWWQRSGS